MYTRMLKPSGRVGRRPTVKEATIIIPETPPSQQRRSLLNRSGPIVQNVSVRGMNLNVGEFKSKDVEVPLASNQAISTTAYAVLLNGLARGDQIDQRIGNEVLMRSIQIDGYLNAQATTGVSQCIRVMLVYDRQANATALALTDVLVASDVHSHKKLENRHRLKIFLDGRIPIASAVTGDASGVNKHPFKYYRKLRHPVVFNTANNGTVADIQTGAMWLFLIGTAAAGNTDARLCYSSRIRYQDK